MAGRYGVAAAGSRTISDPCSNYLCSGDDAQAWFDAGKFWRSFLLGLIIKAKSKVPLQDWPDDLQLGLPPAETSMEMFAGDMPWIVLQSTNESWAVNQQIMRDYAGELADYLEGLGVTVPKKPADAPPAQGLGASIESLVKLAGVAVGAYVLVNVLKASKD